MNRKAFIATTLAAFAAMTTGLGVAQVFGASPGGVEEKYRPLPAPAVGKPPDSGIMAIDVSASKFSASVIEKATEKATAQSPRLGQFNIDSVWQLPGGLQVASGHFAGVGAPAVITVDENGDTSYTGLQIFGSPGPARILGVKGSFLLIGQGRGYQVYNYRTGEVDRSDEQGNPGKSPIVR